MSIFDLLLIAGFLASVATLATVAARAVRGRRTASVTLLRRWVLCVAGYLAVGLAVSWVAPRRIIAVGDPWCFDDWCLTVTGVTRIAAAPDTIHSVALRISSRALRISQRARGAWIYLIDRHGHRYPPETDSTVIPLDTLLGPGESVAASRRFRTPAGVGPLGLVTGHGGPYCGVMNLLVIGQFGCVFHKPAMIAIDQPPR